MTTPEQTPRQLVEATMAGIPGPDPRAAVAAAATMDAKVKPRGSLGRLEVLAARIAGIQASSRPTLGHPVVIVCAADHGVARAGVSAYPQEVTGLMLDTFAKGVAAVSVLARAAGARVIVADLGVVQLPAHAPGSATILNRRVRSGTADIASGPAMTLAEAEQAVAHGIGLAQDVVAAGADLVVPGEMGIGNTTTAAVLTALLLDRDPVQVVGPGTGVAGEALARKVTTVEAVLARHRDATGAWQVLASVGGLEIAALAGVVLGCARHRVPVLLDGVVSTAAAVVARALAPQAAGVLLAGHRSPEPGHDVQLADLGLEPVLNLGLRLGEGSGATLAIPVLRAAVALLTEMGSFADLGLDATAPPV